jgi:hypothetical protein
LKLYPAIELCTWVISKAMLASVGMPPGVHLARYRGMANSQGSRTARTRFSTIGV